MRHRISLLLAACVIAVAAVTALLWRYQRSGPVPASTTRIVPAPPASVVQERDAETGVESSPIASEPLKSADNEPEVQATRRMYMAHAPLRTQEVADPDSEANRQILETMVKKALANSRSETISAPTVSQN